MAPCIIFVYIFRLNPRLFYNLAKLTNYLIINGGIFSEQKRPTVTGPVQDPPAVLLLNNGLYMSPVSPIFHIVLTVNN